MTNKDLISQYVDTGVGIPEYQYNKLSSNDKRTYQRKRNIAANNGEEGIRPYEYIFLGYEFYDSLIKQNIVNSNYQFRRTFKYFPEEIKTKYVDIMINNNQLISDEMFNELSDDTKIKFLNWSAEQGFYKMRVDVKYTYSSEEIKVKFLRKLIELYGIESFIEQGISKVCNYRDSCWKVVLDLVKKYNLDKR